MVIKLISNRLNIIKRKVKNKEVLDVGCVDHLSETENNNYWLHKIIKKNAKSVIGIDIAEEEVKKLNEKGYNIICDNAESFNLNRKFEVIVSCELIEHISNVGIFIENLKKHLEKEGIIIITTPNGFGIRFFLRNLTLGKSIPNSEHVAYYDIYTLKQLFDRFNLEIVEKYYFFDDKNSKLKFYIEKFFASIRKVFSPSILVVLKIKK